MQRDDGDGDEHPNDQNPYDSERHRTPNGSSTSAAIGAGCDAVMATDVDMQISRDIGARVRARRAALGISQDEVAARMGTVQTVISLWERGRRRPSGDTLVRLAAALECHWRDLVYGDSDA